MTRTSGFIVGAYPSAPSFHQGELAAEQAFWHKLASNPLIRGIEQPCLENLHPYGDDFLFKHTPTDWAIVVTAVMGTMAKRATNGHFGLASTDQQQRQACIKFYRHIYEKIQKTNDLFATNKVIALEIQSAPSTGERDASIASHYFADSLKTLSQWDWPCELIIEHCDALTGIAPKKGFLPLTNELDIAQQLNQTTLQNIGLCINWARSVIEGQDTQYALQHTQQAQEKKLLSALMFSGTTLTGAYGTWGDLHAPFAPFDGAQITCQESLMTIEEAKKLFSQAPLETLSFAGIKLLEIDPNASVAHRIAILEDGLMALKLATQG